MDTKYLFLKDNTWVFRIRIPKEFQFYYENNKEYSKVQQQNYELIKALHESGLGYRRIANHLNAKEIKTKKGNLWKHNNVYSVVKKYKEKQKRIILRNKKYKIVIGKMKLEWLKN